MLGLYGQTCLKINCLSLSLSLSYCSELNIANSIMNSVARAQLKTLPFLFPVVTQQIWSEIRHPTPSVPTQ